MARNLENGRPCEKITANEVFTESGQRGWISAPQTPDGAGAPKGILRADSLVSLKCFALSPQVRNT